MSDKELLKAISEIRKGWELQEQIDKAEDSLRKKKMAEFEEQVQLAKSRAEEIINEARKEAQTLLEDGRLQARTFLTEKEEEWRLKEENWSERTSAEQSILHQKIATAEQREAEAFKTGSESGYQAGYDEGLGHFKSMLESLGDVIDSIKKQEEMIYQAHLEHVKTFVKNYTEKVIGVLSTSSTDAVFHNIKTALEEVHRANHLKVVVSSHDFEAINAVKDKFDVLFSPVKKVELLEDKKMSAGGCLLETELGNVDATIDSQMALLWMELSDE